MKMESNLIEAFWSLSIEQALAITRGMPTGLGARDDEADFFIPVGEVQAETCLGPMKIIAPIGMVTTKWPRI